MKETNKTNDYIVRRFKTLLKEAEIVEKEVRKEGEGINSIVKALKKEETNKTEYNDEIKDSQKNLMDKNIKMEFLIRLMDEYCNKIQEYNDLIKANNIEIELTEEEKENLRKVIEVGGGVYKVVDGKVTEDKEVKGYIDKAIKERMPKMIENLKDTYNSRA